MTHNVAMDLTKLGTVTISPDGWVHVSGFESRPPGSCREVANLAAAWALCHLSAELSANLLAPGGGRIVIED